MITDLHIHSKSSDGKFSVEEIVKEAKARNIGFLVNNRPRLHRLPNPCAPNSAKQRESDTSAASS